MLLDRKASLAFKRSQRWLQSAKRAMEDERWDDVVYQSQMAAEQAIKAVLLQLGFRFRRVHDVSEELQKLHQSRELSSQFKSRIQKITEDFLVLTEQRVGAGYGFEEELEVAEFKEAAPEALQKGVEILGEIKDELERIEARKE